VVITGDVSASEDLIIDGQVHGRIEVLEHSLTIGASAVIAAEIAASTVTIMGSVTGNVTASGKVDLRATGSVEGDLVAPLVAIGDGAYLHGSVDTPHVSGSAHLDRDAQQKVRIVVPLPASTTPAQREPVAVAS